jgi:hypothetical protein
MEHQAFCLELVGGGRHSQNYLRKQWFHRALSYKWSAGRFEIDQTQEPDYQAVMKAILAK